MLSIEYICQARTNCFWLLAQAAPGAFDFAVAKRFWPRHVMPKTTIAWLDMALEKGSVRDGHVLIGSTLEHLGFDKTPTEEALASLKAFVQTRHALDQRLREQRALQMRFEFDLARKELENQTLRAQQQLQAEKFKQLQERRYWQFLVVALLLLAVGAFVQPSLMAMLSRRATPETQGEVQGIASMAMGIGSLVAPLLLTAAASALTPAGAAEGRA